MKLKNNKTELRKKKIKIDEQLLAETEFIYDLMVL